MRVEREGAWVETQLGAIVWNLPDEIDVDTARWLAFVALPAALDALAKVPSDGRGKLDESESDDEQTPGQLAIE